MGDAAKGQYIGLFIFIAVIIILIGGLIYLRIKWTSEDRIKKFGRKDKTAKANLKANTK
jgi:hypothetical protein